MDKFFGQLVFFTRVEVAGSNGEVRSKVVRLGSVYCEFPECSARLAQFRDLNPCVGEVRGEFVYREYF